MVDGVRGQDRPRRSALELWQERGLSEDPSPGLGFPKVARGLIRPAYALAALLGAQVCLVDVRDEWWHTALQRYINQAKEVLDCCEHGTKSTGYGVRFG